ncbi:hypothetical protein CHU98_g5152 [Xylaria longipes]|nr:hypothetical protein CHU98_g5152 [Xylaria longipes]
MGPTADRAARIVPRSLFSVPYEANSNSYFRLRRSEIVRKWQNYYRTTVQRLEFGQLAFRSITYPFKACDVVR